ncbi:MAG TPA: hypothetical protein VGB97_02430 [Candidatus Paceibacterota bacterium]|jgi:hypothetical protein
MSQGRYESRSRNYVSTSERGFRGFRYAYASVVTGRRQVRLAVLVEAYVEDGVILGGVARPLTESDVLVLPPVYHGHLRGKAYFTTLTKAVEEGISTAHGMFTCLDAIVEGPGIYELSERKDVPHDLLAAYGLTSRLTVDAVLEQLPKLLAQMGTEHFRSIELVAA